MSLVVSEFGMLTMAFMIYAYFVSARTFTLGAMSLPALMLSTSFIYFYLMPALSFTGRDAEFLGMHIDSLQWPHLAVGLYAAGGVAACFAARGSLSVDPGIPYPKDRRVNMFMLTLLATSAVIATVTHVALGRMNIRASDDYQWSNDVGEYAFINLFFTMMVPLSIVYLVRDKFGVRSLAALTAASFVLLMTGFRYRLIFMAFAVTAAFLILRGKRVRTAFVLPCLLLGLLANNAMVNARTYGAGVNLSKLSDVTPTEILQSFGGEVGPLFSFSFIADNPIAEFIMADPWSIAVARLIPSFLWKDKPTPDYLYISLGGFPKYAKEAGVAAPQHVEMLLQFGWLGLPILAFIYFRLAIVLLDFLGRRGLEVRVAAFALVPVFFGFYMPTRGYFFQILSDGLFTFGPLFLLTVGSRAANPRRSYELSSATTEGMPYRSGAVPPHSGAKTLR